MDPASLADGSSRSTPPRIVSFRRPRLQLASTWRLENAGSGRSIPGRTLACSFVSKNEVGGREGDVSGLPRVWTKPPLGAAKRLPQASLYGIGEVPDSGEGEAALASSRRRTSRRGRR